MPERGTEVRDGGWSLRGVLATQPRQRMAVVALTGLLFGLFSAGVEVALPLWVTSELGWTAAQWAQLRALRMGGVVVGVVLLGALSDRFGQRRLGALSMLAVAVCLELMAGGSSHRLWLVMPFFGALVSTAFVNLNTVTQQVSSRRQGVANSIYRTMGALAAVIAPGLTTALAAAWHGYPPVFHVFAGLLVMSAAVLGFYPGEPPPEPLGVLREEIRRLWEGYRLALGERRLMLVIHLTAFWSCASAGVGTFVAIYYVQHFAQSEQRFGLLASVAGLLSLVVTAGAALVLDRLPVARFYGAASLVAALSMILMGLAGREGAFVLGWLVFAPLSFMQTAPLSLWVSRAAGASSQAAAFSVHKVLSAGYFAATNALLGVLEPVVGMGAIMWGGGLLAALLALVCLVLPAAAPNEGLPGATAK